MVLTNSRGYVLMSYRNKLIKEKGKIFTKKFKILGMGTVEAEGPYKIEQ